MIVGLPREVKEGEYRVGITPQAVNALAMHGHRVLVETGAGEGCGFRDDEYMRAGALLVDEAAEVWRDADMVVKVKEPAPREFAYLRKGLTIFTFLHLAAAPQLTAALLKSGATAIAYETVGRGGRLPLLAPMSEVAGCLAVQKGAWLLETHAGGKGVLIPGLSGAPPASVTVLGGGVAGVNACRVASGMGGRITVLDVSPERLQYLRDIFGNGITTLLSTSETIEESLTSSDLVIGAVLIPGRCAPRLITRDMLAGMPPGGVLVDISIDQGGVSETSRPTTHAAPSYLESGVVHCCITNLPAAVPRSSSLALSSRTLPYIMALADKGVEPALHDDPCLREGLNIAHGEVLHPGLRASLAGEIIEKGAMI
ncbi:MAG: alanine dehydrogenase [Actinobacteria bacterium]|jgi:alanine dehydrogenase|nr:MAG: alanine dehydrogenase [Actinomycetota bacterium]